MKLVTCIGEVNRLLKIGLASNAPERAGPTNDSQPDFLLILMKLETGKFPDTLFMPGLILTLAEGLYMI